MTGSCDCCLLAMNYPDLTRKTYSMGCNYCAARYQHNGGESDLTKWVPYGIDLNVVNRLRRDGEFIDPELKKRRKQ